MTVVKEFKGVKGNKMWVSNYCRILKLGRLFVEVKLCECSLGVKIAASSNVTNYSERPVQVSDCFTFVGVTMSFCFVSAISSKST